MVQPLLPLFYPTGPIPAENRGVVYTKPWVVDLVLDLADYTPESNLVDALAVEPAAGEGAFLSEMACRLVRSCQRQGRPPSACAASLVAYEIDEVRAAQTRARVKEILAGLSIPPSVASGLAEGWVRSGDFLLDAHGMPKCDFVVGNPPYIRLEDIPAETAALYRTLYPTMRGRADIYVAFFEAALRMLNPGGVCAFICADRWMLNQYGADLRKLITSQFSVEAVLEMHDADAFDSDVSAYPAVTVLRRARQGAVVVARLEAPTGEVDPQRVAASLRLPGATQAPLPPIVSSAVIDGWFHGDEPWPCSSPARLRLLRRLEERFEVLEDGDHTRVGIGVATGCDAVFITAETDLVEPSRLLPLALASDTVTGHLAWSGHYLVDPWDEKGLVELSRFPRLREYLEQHKTVLCGRHTARRNAAGWYKTIDRVTHTLRARHKLYIPDIKDQFNPVLDPGTTYPHHNLYFITSDRWDLEVLGGLLLSAVAQLFIEAYGVRMRGGYLRFQAQYLRRVRVPDPAGIAPRLRDRLAAAFRARDRVRATEAALEAYGITAAELEAARGP